MPASHELCSPERMLERNLKRIALVLVGCLLIPGCAHFTKSGRQQLAYEKYVRKQSGNRARQRVKTKKLRIPVLQPSQPKVNTSVNNSPQSMTSAGSQPDQ